ncbi:MAG: hypothetical protein ACMXYA_03765 [Candidatus Woesearchaeota archaeon]
MTQPQVISEEPLDVYAVKKIIKDVKKRDEELGFRATRTETYVNQFTPLTDKDAKALREELLGLDIPRFSAEHITKIIDMLPVSVDDIKLVLSGYNLTIKNDNVKKIDEVLAKYRK